MQRAVLIHWIALTCSLLFLAVIFYFVTREHSMGALIDVWKRTATWPFLIAILIMTGLQALSAWRFEVIMNADGLKHIRFASLLRIQLVSQFVANGAPISALSDLAKAAMLKLRFGLGTGQSIRLVLYERICGALGAIIVGVMAVFGQLWIQTPPGLIKAQVVLWGVGLAAIAALIAIGNLHINTKLEFVDRAAGAITALGRMLRRPAVATKLLLASALLLVGVAIVFIVLARGMQINVSMAHVFLFVPLIFFVSALPVFYQGWGGREAAVVATLGSTGEVTSAEAIALSVAFGVVLFLSSLPGAVFWIMRPSMRKAVRTEAEDI